MGRLIRSTFIVILIATLIVVGFQLYKEFEKYWSAYNQTETIRKEVGRDKKTVKHKKLLKQNKDYIGWLYCPKTVIDYPMVKSHDNKDYLHTGFKGTYVWAGTLFADCRTEKPFVDMNTIIYGHHMMDGSMFHDLDKWKEKKYRKKHNRFYIYTPKKNYVIKIVNVITVPQDDAIYDVPYISDEEITNFLKKVGKGTENDRFVTLSTCGYSFDGARTLVIGTLEGTHKKIEEIEIRKEQKTKWEVFLMMMKELIHNSLTEEPTA